MQNKKSHSMLIAALLMPAIGMLYLYTRNAEYLAFGQVALVTLALMAVSAIGYGLLRLIFRSPVSALLGCLVAWVMFFAFGAMGYELVKKIADNYYWIALIYGAVTLALVALVALLSRRVKGGAIGTVALVMAVIMAALNLYPAISAARNLEQHAADDSIYKAEFMVDAALPSPNVYWIHTDGMLGFDAFARYYGDDQKEFRQALSERGFQINASAQFEAAHTTALAVPSLMNPAFYDTQIAPRAQTHEDAMALRADKRFVRNEALSARIDSELRLGFEQKGYQTQTMAGFGIYFPPVTDRFYMTGDSRGAYRLALRDPQRSFLSIVEATELSILLLKMPSGMFFNAITRLFGSAMGIERQPLTNTLATDRRSELMLGSQAAKNDALLFDALYDSIKTQRSPSLSILFFLNAHYPYRYQADGSAQMGDQLDIMNYVGNHQYAAKLLVNMVDMILESDPDAVIVIQADHGLHSQSEAAIAGAFGPDAVLPIWNQVMSAVRIPEQYKDGEEAAIADSPLNISRYLLNRFVGEDYSYIGGAIS